MFVFLSLEKYELEQLVRHLLSDDINDKHLEQGIPMGESTNVYVVSERETG